MSTYLVLLFQPPHSPEVNMIERVWQEIKKWLKWELFSDLDELREALKNILNKLSQTVVMSQIN